ncbi:hypothetical protein HN51_061570 [Arachis hypogaea]|uniref:PGG domain-containing protein n=2 Tax=Arachis hypogaea TaxID=3818 RepID=A0A445ANS8_ARAHY|nr:uncharacterized protein LOC107624012 isoform X1 [Arachis ipaensis]XP_020972866.1 uncharacterized protein LOC107624012 isoform X1 [Arachis ipaensis]XP_025626831.1 uncharacterized protein LOC112720195 isoform X1 [Arachis hypogaea]QHO18862.1 uncharacterized protein DS421_11g324110 [Arachis hypogaea]QHO18863.1 uncharacterized protein DS421_11g324110 [Arachis hypogaea]RYR28091.1 hypothetical protein Ahy_B01g052200 isoform A [Arachis hypogaea]
MSFAESSPAMSMDDVMAATNEFARGFNHSYYLPLHMAILKGDWESAKSFLDADPSAWTSKITSLARTPLHVAAVGAQWKILEKLVHHVPSELLAELDSMGFTCLHYVAMGESIDAAKALLAKNHSLTQITDFKGFTPLLYSVTSTRCKEMAWYLAMNTVDERPGFPFSSESSRQLVALLTAAGFHDITMYLLQRYPNLATISDSNGSIILNVLSKKTSDFQSGNKFGILHRCIYHCVPAQLDHLPHGDLRDSYDQSSHHQSYSGSKIWNAIQTSAPSIKHLRDAKLRQVFSERLVEHVCSQASTMSNTQFWESFVSMEIIYNATSSGIVEILRICFQFFPDLVWTRIPNEGYIVQIAIKYRQEKVFGFICKMPIISKILILALDESHNTTSHLAARSAHSQLLSVSGAAFKMQKELQWFKKVEQLDHPIHKEIKNQDGKTAWQLFKEEHKTLLEESEKWMRDTANSCSIVAALIVTTVFAAVLTVPGGNNQEKGFPIFLPDNTFLVFAASVALALFSSMASLLMFLSILTARYAEKDFLKALPRRLIWGLALLFFAIVTTMVAFAAALSLVLRNRLKWVWIPIAIMACVPIALFAKLQIPLFGGMIISTYRSSIYHP